MGITIECEKSGRSCDLGYGGFGRFREKVAFLLNEEFGNHYAKLSTPEMMFTFDSEKRKQLYDEFNEETERLIKKYKLSKRAVSFLNMPDCGGKASPSACKVIYKAIRDYDDSVCYGYSGRSNCAMFGDLKQIIKDYSETNSYLIWS